MASSSPLTGVTLPAGTTAVLVLGDGSVLPGKGLGAPGTTFGELCFNTSMSGYQEILTDPSYAGQIITFTFPHIGNVGCNEEDIETVTPAARGLVVRQDITAPSNWRAAQPLDAWLRQMGLTGISGVDTRRLTRRLRDRGALTALIAHVPEGPFDIESAWQEASAWPGLTGLDLAAGVSRTQASDWQQGCWQIGRGYGWLEEPRHHVVAIDFGAKHNILRCLAEVGCRVTVLPATTSGEDILAHKPDGVFLSNGPGDPEATGAYAIPAIRAVLEAGLPLFGICLGHQMLALALGAKTYKMHTGHRGANHPVKDLATGRVEITSQNHGFVVDPETLPKGVSITHRSLFDGSLEGLRLDDRPVFSVQYHPEASPGPRDSFYLFERFSEMMAAARGH